MRTTFLVVAAAFALISLCIAVPAQAASEDLYRTIAWRGSGIANASIDVVEGDSYTTINVPAHVKFDGRFIQPGLIDDRGELEGSFVDKDHGVVVKNMRVGWTPDLYDNYLNIEGALADVTVNGTPLYIDEIILRISPDRYFLWILSNDMEHDYKYIINRDALHGWIRGF